MDFLPPAGLPNVGNTCFVNATLQGLAAVSRLCTYSMAGSGLANQAETALCAVLHAMLTSAHRVLPHNADALSGMLALLPAVMKSSYTPHRQHDAAEFLECLLAACMPAAFVAHPGVFDMFVVNTATDVVCSKCGASSSQVEPQTVLRLPLPSSNVRMASSMLSVEECLRAYASVQVMDGADAFR